MQNSKFGCIDEAGSVFNLILIFKGELDQSGRYCGPRETVQVPPLQNQEPQVI